MHPLLKLQWCTKVRVRVEIVISTKYGEGQGGWCTKVCRRTHGCGLWRSINGRWGSFSNNLSFVVGEGTCTRF